MVEYKVGDLSQLISNDKGKALDDLFKATTRPITSLSEVLQSQNVSEEKSKLKKENTEKNVPKNVKSSPDSQKFTQPSRKFQINNEESYKTKERDLEKEKRTVFIGNLPSTITKKQLKNVFSTMGSIDAIRFRGAARPGNLKFRIWMLSGLHNTAGVRTCPAFILRPDTGCRTCLTFILQSDMSGSRKKPDVGQSDVRHCPVSGRTVCQNTGSSSM